MGHSAAGHDERRKSCGHTDSCALFARRQSGEAEQKLWGVPWKVALWFLIVDLPATCKAYLSTAIEWIMECISGLLIISETSSCAARPAALSSVMPVRYSSDGPEGSYFK